MSETHQDSGAGGGDIDLSQFYQIFFEEAGENLDLMETMLLNLNLETADDEELNGIFRCAHSVKGGAATFGFADVAARVFFLLMGVGSVSARRPRITFITPVRTGSKAIRAGAMRLFREMLPGSIQLFHWNRPGPGDGQFDGALKRDRDRGATCVSPFL